MKITWKENLVMILAVLAVLVIMTGCEYDAPTAMWYQDRGTSVSPVITQINPAQALGGVNYLTIMGENFSTDSGSNRVYVDGVKVDIVEYSETSLKVRRPSVTGDSTTIKVATATGVDLGIYTGYSISTVVGPYGGFIASEQFGALALDKSNETVYAFDKVYKNVYQVTADGEKTQIGTSERAIKDALVAPDGGLVLLLGRKNINKMDPVTGEEIEWINIEKSVTFGDYDANGNLFVSGKKSDVYVIAPDLTYRTLGLYVNDNVLALRIFGNDLYVAVELKSPADGEPETGIWKHEILDANGNLGPRELVLDWSQTGDYAESTILDISLSASGILYVDTDNTQPMFMVDRDGNMDILYKDIIAAGAQRILWGTGNLLYLVLDGDTSDLLFVDMGEGVAQ